MFFDIFITLKKVNSSEYDTYLKSEPSIRKIQQLHDLKWPLVVHACKTSCQGNGMCGIYMPWNVSFLVLLCMLCLKTIIWSRKFMECKQWRFSTFCQALLQIVYIYIVSGTDIYRCFPLYLWSVILLLSKKWWITNWCLVPQWNSWTFCMFKIAVTNYSN